MGSREAEFRRKCSRCPETIYRVVGLDAGTERMVAVRRVAFLVNRSRSSLPHSVRPGSRWLTLVGGGSQDARFRRIFSLSHPRSKKQEHSLGLLDSLISSYQADGATTPKKKLLPSKHRKRTFSTLRRGLPLSEISEIHRIELAVHQLYMVCSTATRRVSAQECIRRSNLQIETCSNTRFVPT